ncbi:MAG: hypothetical protein ACRDQA_14785 [Nocardioidaceae bacterium]
MAAGLRCPACGEDEDLRGNRTRETIRVTCECCGASWDRDTTPACATCGGDEIIFHPRAMTQYSRGAQLSIVGWQNVPLCLTCDAAAITKSTTPVGRCSRATGPTGAQSP